MSEQQRRRDSEHVLAEHPLLQGLVELLSFDP